MYVFNGSILVPDKLSESESIDSISLYGEFVSKDTRLEGILNKGGEDFDICGGFFPIGNKVFDSGNNIILLSACRNGKTIDTYFLVNNTISGVVYSGICVPSSQSYNFLHNTNLNNIIEYISFCVEEKKSLDVKVSLGRD